MTIIGFGIFGMIAVTGVRAAVSISVGGVSVQSSGLIQTISVPVSLRNPGPLSLNDINVSVLVLNTNGSKLFTGGGGPVSLPAGSSGNLPITVNFNLGQLPESELRSLAMTNQNLTLSTGIGASVSSLTNFAGVFDTVYQWKAPVSNLKLGLVSVIAYNKTYAKFNAPLSFEDQSQTFAVTGSAVGTILDQSGSAVGTVSELKLDVSPSSSFSGQVSGYISSTAINQDVKLQLVFSTSFGNFSEAFVANA
jgi:hypothetical protein